MSVGSSGEEKSSQQVAYDLWQSIFSQLEMGLGKPQMDLSTFSAKHKDMQTILSKSKWASRPK